MKIPEGLSTTSAMWDLWHATAARLSLKHNIYIEVVRASAADTLGNVRQVAIYFKIDGHKFDSLKDLKSALKLKAFL